VISSHINAIERILVAQSEVASNAGHPNLRGGPREWFIRTFLNDHLPRNLEVGQGEIIDRNSIPGPSKVEYRSQEDIVIYRKDFPRLTYSPQDWAFLAEGVIATLEVKSVIDEEQLKKACHAALKCKNLERSELQEVFGRPPSDIFCYLVAYDGPAQMRTLAQWLPRITDELGTTFDKLLDTIVVLGKGALWHRLSFATSVDDLVPETGERWAFFEQENGNLLLLFTHMLSWMPYMIVPPSFLEYTQDSLFDVYQTVD